MYFKKLEIFGFKSFADKTVLNFEPGITAIVGPNGCGKSNVFDSIRWVLGEQSVKELRGSSMEDVIFNGTDKKPALGFAEVSLTFSNESKMLPIEYSEVTVTRRLYRSGESEYLLNKTPVRLKDILELFMGTGIGAEAYSLVQQGKVDLVVSAKPEERRIIIDEASGITKYKSKKREALNKLKDTDNNLLRINDIVTEVKRQIGSIERQANKARRYKEEYEKLKVFEIQLARYQLNTFGSKKEQIAKTLEELKEREANLTEELSETNNLLESQSQALDEIEDKINEINSEDIKIDGQMDLDNKQIGFNEERTQSIDENSVRLAEKKEELIRQCREEQARIEGLKQELAGVEEKVNQKTAVFKEKKEALVSVESTINSAKRDIRDNEEQELNITSKQVSIKNQLTEIMKETQGAIARKRRLELEREKVSTEKIEIDERMEMVSEQIGRVSEKLQDLRSDHEDKVRVFTEIKSKISSTHKEVADLEKKRVLVKSQKEFIETLNVQYQDIPDPVIEGRLITTSSPDTCHTGIIGKVKEVQYLDSEKCRIFKNGFVNQPLGDQFYEVVCEAKFIELDPEQMRVKIEELSKEIDIKTREKEEWIRQIELQEEAIKVSVRQVQDQEKLLSILESQKRGINEELSKLAGEIELVDSEIVETKESMDALKKKEDELSYHLDSLNQDLVSCQSFIKERQDLIAEWQKEREGITVQIAQLEAELESFQEKQNSQQENISRFSQTLDRELEEIKKIDDEKTEQSAKREFFQEEITQLKVKIGELQEKKESLKGVLGEHEKERGEIAQRLKSFRSNVTGIEEELSTIKKDIHDQEMKGQELGFGQQGIKDRLSQTYKISLEEYAEPDEATKEILQQFPLGTEAFETELNRLKKRCDSFGSVNLVAIEEFEELKGRFEFLTKQQSDLIESKESLHKTINKINRKTRQMFMDTFTKVSEEFRIYFRMLFGGGEADLVLLDPDNVLESGIEIVARPPGKKLQSISLLSGGEKTLTAIALIFGVFKVNPSPFCVLDEIDAALDESNVGRYSYLLKDFAKVAQFIVITHNKKTITSADILYGITMQERGVSKVVSVKLSDDEKKQAQEVPVGA